ncbi:multicopper oxidase domain-containing protein [Paenibacillus sp. BR2-3]|uniref:multicopper oxidase domain-containing protein n=1 Tax=Paenibacillus sp. BR2-3 TaxID=3048494 RepID=UPI003977BD7A
MPLPLMGPFRVRKINGKAFPDTQAVKVKKGEVVRLRLINISNAAHPMHLHGHDFRVIAEDGHPVAEPQVMNTIDVAPGKTYDIEFIADNPGTWLLHCHELHHTMNGEVEPGGLIGVIQYDGQPALETTPGQEEGKDKTDKSDMPDKNNMTAFKDMENHPAASYVEFLRTNGMIAGVGNGMFLPDQTIKVKHLNLLLQKVTGKEFNLEKTDRLTVFQELADGLGLATQAKMLTDKQTNTLLGDYKDLAGISLSALKTIAFLVQQGILVPKEENGLLRPNEKLTRAEAATVIAKLIQKDLIAINNTGNM